MRFSEVSGGKLRDLRGKRSRELVAHELRKLGHGTDAKAIWRYETGRSQPSARILPDYAAVLGVDSIDELYGDDGDEEEAALHPLARDLAIELTRVLRVAEKVR